MSKLPKRVKYIYNIPKDYKIYPVSGAYGGVSGRGDLVLHFFVESHAIPKDVIQKIKGDGHLSPEERIPTEELEMTRDMQIGVMVSRTNAVELAKWILDKVKGFEKLTKQKGSQK